MNIMKKTLSILIAALGMILAAACENEPHQVQSYITSPAMMAKISEGLQGKYTGKLLVVMDDTTSHIMHNAEGTWERKAYVDSIPAFTYSVSALTKTSLQSGLPLQSERAGGEAGAATAHVTIPHFPIRWLARSVSNSELRKALKDHPDATLELDYELHGETYVPESHKGYLRAKSLPLDLDVTLAGTTHKLTLEFKDVLDLVITADDSDSWRISYIQMDVSKVLLDGEILEVFDDAWTAAPSPTFLINLQGVKEGTTPADETTVIQKK